MSESKSVRRRLREAATFPTCSEWIHGTEGQKTRNWFRHHVFSRTSWQVFVSIFFTLIHDVAGFFSASSTIMTHFTELDQPWERLVVVYLPIVIFDCGSELLLVFYHDLPLFKDEFQKDEPSTKTKVILRLALVGQILTSICWLALFGFVLYDAIFAVCPVNNSDAFSKCKALLPGATEAMVVFMVLLKNSMTLKEYNERIYVYPIICNEEVLYLNHIEAGRPSRIIESFEKYHGLSESVEMGFFDSANFNVAFNYVILMITDIAYIASVSNLIVVHDATPVQTAFRAIPFVIILGADILSESLILIYHDLPLLNLEYDIPHKYKKIFDTSRLMQVFVNFAWLASLIYMVWVVVNLDCVAECYCTESCSDFSLTCPAVNSSRSCFSQNSTYAIPISFTSNTTFNCSVTFSVTDCEHSSPSMSSCILLGLVLLDSFYQLGQMFFKSYIYPLTVPEYVMFLQYWHTGAHNRENITSNKIVCAVGKNEFGPDWDPTTDLLGDPLLTEDEKNVALEDE